MATNGSATCLGTSQDDQVLNEDQESQVKPKPLLLKLLRFAGAQSETFTVKEVMHYLGQYIITKQLYDEKQQHIVHCSDDLLSHLFGVQSFSIKEPRTLYAMLSKNLTSVNHEDSINDLNLGKITNQLGGEDCLVTVMPNDGNACTSCNVSYSPAAGRRSNCSDSDNDVSSDEQFYNRRRKRHRSDSISLHWDDLSLCLISKLRRERGNSESSDSPSHLDIHVGTEGEDSSDKFSVEFEVESVHSEDYSDFSEDSQDGSDEEIYEVAIFEAADSDEGTFIEEIDPEISEADYWKCSKCEELNPPLPRHCHRCWSVRQDWLPDKPKIQQSDKEQDEGIDVPDCKKPPLESKESNCSDLISEASHCSESQETECSQPSTSGSFHCCSQEMEKENGEKGELNTLGPLEACVICQARPKNGCIVHGRTGHLLACYTCAKKLKKRNKPCPLCREPIQLVVLTYFS
ncbi:E3 ubiquitin-protein ligase Mdm2 isoform X1 [Carcharodon carcharias]|uniref:E3 ubiquitin-protein ligase Mdm2 isoform X1 n=1 Tax=Carcharodon carcharias TaxID=13397 RepID=UPI001B7E7815|nr:E3 ubiquitin-protein ligase Mdm2 isoform X1 [Carcharodon carcharias]XP_041072227.1 E3 ubiquitin-protein ligase Mdm2 isoform X1 [Carcharodon carcharias]